VSDRETQSEPDPAPRRDARPRPRATRVALVGAGNIADTHLEILAALAGVEVVAVVDPALERARALAAKWSVPHALAAAGELAGLRIDAAHVLVPPDRHAAVARELLELGLDLLVEKPLCLSAAEARALAALAEERGLSLGVNHNHLHQPAFVRLTERVRAGEIGRVEHVQVTWSVPLKQLEAEQYAHWMFRAPRNIVFEQATHPLCQVHALIGAVKSAQTTLLGTRELLSGQLFHDRWLCAARGQRGTAEIHLAFGQGFARNTIQVLGSDGSLEADFTHDTLAGETKTKWLEFWNGFLAASRRGRAYRRDAWRVLCNYLLATLGLRERRDAYFAGMRGSLAAFHAALRAGRRPPVDGVLAAEVLAWCEALAAPAAAEGAPPVELDHDGPARPGEVVVLGGTGFIGRRVVERLLAAGRPVTCVVRRAHSLPAPITAAAHSGRLRLVRGSLGDAAAIERALAGAEVVVHLATGDGDTWAEVERNMVRGSAQVAEACLRHGARRLVYVSSIAALYTGADAGALIEDSPATDPRPERRSLYSRGKIATEEVLQALHRERALPLVVVRPGIVVGAGAPMRHSGYGLWARDNHCIGWGAGEHPLPLVWVEDAAEGIARAALHPGGELDGRALNLCARVPLGARRIVAELAAESGRALHFHRRSLALSQALEIGKWLVKVAGRRAGAEFPSWRDLKARALVPAFSARTAREVLGWRPLEDEHEFLARVLRGEDGRDGG